MPFCVPLSPVFVLQCAAKFSVYLSPVPEFSRCFLVCFKVSCFSFHAKQGSPFALYTRSFLFTLVITWCFLVFPFMGPQELCICSLVPLMLFPFPFCAPLGSSFSFQQAAVRMWDAPLLPQQTWLSLFGAGGHGPVFPTGCCCRPGGWAGGCNEAQVWPVWLMAVALLCPTGCSCEPGAAARCQGSGGGGAALAGAGVGQRSRK